MAKQRKKGSGGARMNAGRKPVEYSEKMVTKTIKIPITDETELLTIAKNMRKLKVKKNG